MPTLPSHAVSQQCAPCCCATALNGNIHVASLIALMLLRRQIRYLFFFFFLFMYNCALFLSFFIIFNVGHVHENMVVLLGQDI